MIIIPFIIVDILTVYQNYAFTRAQCNFGLTVCVLFFVFAFIVIMWGECDFFPV